MPAREHAQRTRRMRPARVVPSMWSSRPLSLVTASAPRCSGTAAEPHLQQATSRVWASARRSIFFRVRRAPLSTSETHLALAVDGSKSVYVPNSNLVLVYKEIPGPAGYTVH